MHNHQTLYSLESMPCLAAIPSSKIYKLHGHESIFNVHVSIHNLKVYQYFGSVHIVIPELFLIGTTQLCACENRITGQRLNKKLQRRRTIQRDNFFLCTQTNLRQWHMKFLFGSNLTTVQTCSEQNKQLRQQVSIRHVDS